MLGVVDPCGYLTLGDITAIGALFEPVVKGYAGGVYGCDKPCGIVGISNVDEHVAKLADCFMCWVDRVFTDIAKRVALYVDQAALDGYVGPFTPDCF